MPGRRRAACFACFGVVMQNDWKQGDVTPAGDPIIVGSPRKEGWEAPEFHAENIELIEAHMETALGTSDPRVFHEILSDTVHIDVLCYPPDDTRDYYVYVTSGMSDLPMTLPDGVPEEEYARAELMLALPRTWGEKVEAITTTTKSGDPDNTFWPISVMKWLARYPHQAHTWFGPGHTIPNPDGTPYDESARFNGVILIDTSLLPPDTARPHLPSGEYLNFYGVVFLYPEEMDLKLEKGADTLLDRLFSQGHPEYLDLTRKTVVRTNPILRLLKGN